MCEKEKRCINWPRSANPMRLDVEGYMKFGTVGIIGRSNVGKSTLLNRLLDEKIAIVSDKPQTTRTRILGVAHTPDAQIAFLDTPGFHEPQHLLNRRMVRTALDVFDDADLLYVLVDATCQPGPGDRAVIDHVRKAVGRQPRPVVLVINKIDLVNKARLLPLIDNYARLFSWTEIVPVSAQRGDNVSRLMELTVTLIPEGPPVYGDDMFTDQSMRTLAAELIREKILEQTYEEIPHSVAVEIEQFQEARNLARISAAILVEKESQKAIVIGKHGERLKMVGTAARRDMERLFGMKVFLEMWVKVRDAWREDEHVLAELGY
jgi:GTP-binding protein Era